MFSSFTTAHITKYNNLLQKSMLKILNQYKVTLAYINPKV